MGNFLEGNEYFKDNFLEGNEYFKGNKNKIFWMATISSIRIKLP
jgi:hypothetical protein